ncbi:MAG: NAD(+)/NADH kinase [Candidatus Thermoplasmatota archaeon]|nr:NAD(+)/NADH kinase [Candidatus Thermoplasmatota archaeon]MEC9001564.1 NAD(+)/NADH kinase [Candidatus Thermoplasmatota archaeon]MEE3315794.1 NAD(+)/NADH kinase [Candidatus Thermoplasmatota archaeon]
MARLGLLVNPDAGLGGRLGLKGSDGQAELARSMGAEDRSGPRMRAMLEHFSSIHRSGFEGISWVTSEGRMGTEWLPEAKIGSISTVHSSSGKTSADDTQDAVNALLKSEIDLLVYAGGDGTTRDVVAALESAESSETPVIGVPTGVKMHSGCFAASPKAAAEALSSWLIGDLLLASTEVLDLDEDRYRQGEWIVQLYAEAMTPSSPRWMQGSKQRIEASGEEDTTEGLADHIREILVSEDRMLIWGSGGTLRRIAEMNEFQPTNLGIDATIGNEQVGTDLSESDLLALLSEHDGPTTLLLSPMGGQGFLIGRGNLQLSPQVLRLIGIDNILGVVTPAKLLSVRRLRIETGDSELDADFAAMRYMKVLQGYRTTRVLPVAVD